MKLSIDALRRPAAGALAFALLAGSVIPAMPVQQAYADQLLSRIVKMSDSTPSASAQYEITFTTGAAVGTTEELVIDFCSDTPLFEATCAFSAATVPTIAAPTSSAGTPSTVGSGTPLHTVLITGLTMVQNATYTITLTGGITNPTTATSFYARMYTYNTGQGANYVPANVTGGVTDDNNQSVDFGGAALSTVTQVTVTARVMETLTFCVTKDNLDGTLGAGTDECSEATLAPAVDIGQGTPRILDPSRIDADTVYTQLSTNATSGAIVRMKATNTCANSGLSAGDGTTCNIPGINGGGDGSTATNLVAGTAAYGLFVSDSRTTSTGAPSTGTITADANYNNGTNENEGAPDTIHYGMDSRNTTDGVRSTYGDAIASSAGPVSRVNNNLVFAATSSLTTPAGIYTANEILIATGTF